MTGQMMRVDTKRYKLFLKIFLLALTTVPVFVIAIGATFESRASRNSLINISKRGAAEAGAIISGNMMIFKNVMKWEDGNEIPFGPGAMSRPAGVVDAGEYVREKLDNVKITDTRYYNVSKYATAFQYEDLLAPQLKVLRERYGLDKLTEGLREMEKFIVLRDWVKNAIPRGRPKDVDYNFNAIDILMRAKNGEVFFCSEYSTVFTQCALSLGLAARYAGLFKGHVIAEVWSDDFAKWIVMDVDNNLHYERDGIPLNALELHRALELGRYSNIRALRGPARQALTDAETAGLLSYYHEFYVRMRNDWFSHRYPHWHHKANSIMNGLEWRDEFTRDNILVAHSTRNPQALYFPINIVSLDVDPGRSSAEKVQLVFSTFTPNFSHFVAKVDKKDEALINGHIYNWNLHPGVNILQVHSVNERGVPGPESNITLHMD